MHLLLPFLSGFLASAIGVFPPGLINMTAAKVGLRDGKKQALFFVLGALVVIFFQTYISVIFAQYIDQHQEIVEVLREIGLGVFVLLTLYFLVFAKKPKIKDDELKVRSKRSRFFMGMIISAINFFPIPYYVLVSITLATYQVFSFELVPIYLFVTGVVLGSFTVFYLYIIFFNKMKSKTDFFVSNMNKIIGLITGLIALATFLNVIKYYV